MTTLVQEATRQSAINCVKVLLIDTYANWGLQKVQHLLWVKMSLFLFLYFINSQQSCQSTVCRSQCAQKREKRTTGQLARQSAERGHPKLACLLCYVQQAI